MRLWSLLPLALIVLVSLGSMRSVSSQSPISGIPDMLKGMSINDKVALIADILIKQPVLFEKLEHILLGALPLISTFKIKPEINMFILPWVLDSIPNVLQNPILLNISTGVVDDMNHVNVSGLNTSGIDPFMTGFMQRYNLVESGIRAAIDAILISRGLNQPYSKFVASKSTKILEKYGEKVLDATIEYINTISVSGIAANDSRMSEMEFWEGFSLLSLVSSVLTPVEQFLPRAEGSSSSPKCYNDTMIYLNNLLQGTTWAVKMFDATGKPPTGTLTGNLHFVGSYDQCLAIKPEKTATNKHLSATGSRYCRATFDIPANLMTSVKSFIGDVNTYGVPITVTWGLCLPSTCQEHDVTDLFRLGFLQSFNLEPSVVCYTAPDLQHDDGAIIVIFVLCLIAAICFIATLFHIYRFDDDGEEDEPVFATSTADAHDNKGYIPEVDDETTFSPGQKIGHVANGHINVSDDDSFQIKESGWKQGVAKAFSLYQNIPDVLSFDHDQDSIQCVHGIRFLSLAWLVLGNSFLFAALSLTKAPVTGNLLEGLEMMKGFAFQAVFSSPFAIDSFFVISGFLLTYKFLNKCTNKGKVEWQAILGFYSNRYIRITPVYMVIMVSYVWLYHFVGDSPIYPKAIGVADKCKQDWWHHILFINNIVGTRGNVAFEQCMPWSWFLACIMQFYLITPILFMIYLWSSALGSVFVGLLLTASVVATAIKERRYPGNVLSMMSDGGDYWNNVFITPWCRVSAYCIGILLGFLFDTLESSKKVKISKWQNILGWLVSFGLFITVAYTPFTKNREGGDPWTSVESAVYEAMSHVVWAVALSWVIFACTQGYGGVINWVLSWRGFLPLSRLSFAVYLIHPVVMVLFIYNKQVLVYMNTFEMAYMFLGHLIMSYAVGLLFCVGVERPFIRLLKLLKTRGRKS